jgi:penicillin-binding protein 1A
VALKGWKPENYSRDYHGPVTLSQALALSFNTVSVRLTLEVGPSAVARTAYRLGIASKLDANPSLALGTSEVSLIELTCARRRLSDANHTPYCVSKGGNGAGTRVLRHPRQCHRSGPHARSIEAARR